MSNLLKAGSWFQRIALARTKDGGPPTRIHKPVAASQTIKRGHPVVMSLTTGELTLGADASPSFYGVANGDVTTTAADEKTLLEVIVADRRHVFEAQCVGIASGTLEEATETDLAITATTVKVEDSTTEGHVMIEEWVPGDDKTDTTNPGRVRFVFKRSSYDALVAEK